MHNESVPCPAPDAWETTALQRKEHSSTSWRQCSSRYATASVQGSPRVHAHLGAEISRCHQGREGIPSHPWALFARQPIYQAGQTRRAVDARPRRHPAITGNGSDRAQQLRHEGHQPEVAVFPPHRHNTSGIETCPSASKNSPTVCIPSGSSWPEFKMGSARPLLMANKTKVLRKCFFGPFSLLHALKES